MRRLFFLSFMLMKCLQNSEKEDAGVMVMG